MRLSFFNKISILFSHTIQKWCYFKKAWNYGKITEMSGNIQMNSQASGQPDSQAE
jgi:hypothetical protein